MVKSSDAPVEIEPLTKDELKEQHGSTHVETDPEYPSEWKDKAKEISDSIDKGFRYYKRRQGERIYMVLRKGKHDKGLGLYSEEKEGKLFAFYPQLQPMPSIPRPAPWTPQGTAPQRSFLSVPILRTAIIPRDYVPTISVIRYFQILKENGFPGDFSKFINDVVTWHFKVCHHMKLPVLVEEEEAEEKCEIEQADST